MEEDAATQYGSLLVDLKINSKPLINVLTMMAEDFLKQAPIVVQTIERHLQSVHPNVKLPVLYLIDSIVKNVGQEYPNLFTQNIVSTFCGVFEKVQKVDDKVKQQMFKLRQTWNDVFPQRKLYAIDVRCHQFDKNWPISAPPPSNTSSIHVNPKFLNPTAQPNNNKPPTTTQTNNNTTTAPDGVANIDPAVVTPAEVPRPQDVTEAHMRAKLLQKQKELLELQQKKIELELMQTKSALESKRLEEIESTVKQEKMLLSQAEKAKTKTHIAHQLLTNFSPLSQPSPSITMKVTHSPTSQPQTAQSLVPAPPVKIEKRLIETDKEHKERDKQKDKERGKSKEKERDRDNILRGKRSPSSSIHKDEKDSKIRRSYKDEVNKRSPVNKSISAINKSPVVVVKEEEREKTDDRRSPSSKRSPRKFSGAELDELIPSSKEKIEVDKSSRNKHKRSSSKDSKSSSKTRDGHRDKDKRSSKSPSKYKKGAVIKEEGGDSFHARRFAVLKRNYRKTTEIEADEEENTAPKKQSSIENPTTTTIDVDLRFEGRRGDVDVYSKEDVDSQNESPTKKPRSSGNGNTIVDLFGREDVDLRQPCGNWMVPGGAPPNWDPRMNMRDQWGPNAVRSPRGPNPFEEALIEEFPRQNEREMRPAERDGPFNKGGPAWLPNPNHPRMGNMNNMGGDQWGPPHPGPRGPNPFETALDQGLFMPGPPTEMEMRFGERPGHFNKAQRRRGQRGRRGLGRGGFMEHNMPLSDQQLMEMRNFPFPHGPPPLFSNNPEQQRMLHPRRPEESFNSFPNELTNAEAEQQNASNNDNSQTQDSNVIADVDVSSLLELAAKFGLLPSSEPVKESEMVEPEKEKIVEAKANEPQESAVMKFRKKQKMLRNIPKKETPAPPPLPTVDVLLVSEGENPLKERRKILINQLWTGMQCATCGLRFPPDQTVRYSQHLDWHFRRNRREKANAKKAQSRAWYYKLSDWIQFEEVEDLDERAPSSFEQNEADPDTASPTAAATPEECSVEEKGHKDSLCPQCGEKFESFYDQEKEEWRLRDAVLDEATGEEIIYHFICYQDYLKSLTEEQEPMQIEQEEAAAVTVDQQNMEEATGAVEPPVEDDDEVLILKEGKKEVLVEVMEIDDVDDEDSGLNEVKSDKINDNEKNKEIENGPESPQETSTTENSDNILSTDRPVLNYSIISRPIPSPIVVNDDSSSNLLPGISEDSSGGVFGFALNLGIIRERSESPEQVDEKKIVYKSMEFDFPKIKIEPPDDDYVPEPLALNPEPADIPMVELDPVPDQEPIDLTGEDDSVDACDGPPHRSLHQTTSIDGNLHQEEYVPVPFVPPTKMRINISGLDFSGKSPSKSPSKNESKPEESSASPAPIPEKDPTTSSPKSPTTTNVLENSPENSDSDKCNTEIVFTEEMKRLKPRLNEFFESGRKFKNCPPKEGRKEESGLCVIS